MVLWYVCGENIDFLGVQTSACWEDNSWDQHSMQSSIEKEFPLEVLDGGKELEASLKKVNSGLCHTNITQSNKRITPLRVQEQAGLPGTKHHPSVQEGMNAQQLSSKLEFLRDMEKRVFRIRAIALSSKNAEPEETCPDTSSGYPWDPKRRLKQLYYKLEGLPDSLLIELGKIGEENTQLRRRLLKKTLDFGYVFRECAIRNVWQYVHRLGMSENEVLRMLYKDPLFATRSFSRGTIPKITWLRDIGVDNDIIIHKILPMANKTLFRCSLRKLKENYTWLCSIGLSKAELAKLLMHCPQILQKALDSLDQKLMFAIIVLGKDIYDLVTWPTYFTYSFEDRIILRTVFCSMAGIEYKRLSFAALLGSSDSKFLGVRWKDEEGEVREFPDGKFLEFKEFWLTLDRDQKYIWFDKYLLKEVM